MTGCFCATLDSKSTVTYIYLVKKFCPQLYHARGLSCFVYINVVDGCLHKCVEVDKSIVIRQVKDKLGIEQFIKRTQTTSCLAGNKPLVHHDVVVVNLTLSSSDGKEVCLSTMAPIKMGYNAATHKWSF